jgi:hypothetical protein
MLLILPETHTMQCTIKQKVFACESSNHKCGLTHEIFMWKEIHMLTSLFWYGSGIGVAAIS